MSFARRPQPAATDPSGRGGRTVRRGALLGLAGVMLVAGPAGAHPFVRGGEAPVDSLATITLAMAHGCDSETAGEGDATTDVSLEVPTWLRVVEVPDEAGWTVDLEEADDGTLEVVTWTATDAQEPAPDFDLDVVASGEIGEERYLRVFQACDDFVYRWIGTPDEPADDPAIRLTLTAADPDAPPPPADAPEPADAEATDTAPEPEDAPDGDADPDAAAADDPAEADAADDADEEADELTDAPADEEPAPLAAESDEGGLPGWFVPVTVLVLLGAVGAVLLGRRGRATT